MDLKELQAVGDDVDSHWYYKHKLKLLMQLLQPSDPATVLDIGAGSGYFSKKLLECTNVSHATCVDIGYEREYDSKVCGKSIEYRKSPSGKKFDAAILMDVLEHVESDRELLESYLPSLEDGGTVVITVPAFMFLWSGHDVFLEHYRRYTRPQLQGVVQSAGLRIETIGYSYSVVFPIAFMQRMIQKMFSGSNDSSALAKHSSVTNWILGFLCRIERKLLITNRFLGLSVVCVATKD